MSEVKAPMTLTPRQIAWCREWIPAFSEAWKSVQESDKWAAKVRAKLGAPEVPPPDTARANAGEG